MATTKPPRVTPTQVDLEPGGVDSYDPGTITQNDSDPNGGTLSVTQVSHGSTVASVPANSSVFDGNGTSVAGTYGTLTVGSDGSLSYDTSSAADGLAIVTAKDGAPIVDTFGDVITESEGPSRASTIAVTVSLDYGSENVVDATGNATFSLGSTELDLTNDQDTTYGGLIQDGSSGNTGGSVYYEGGEGENGSGTLTLTGTGTFTGGTTVASGTLIESDTGTALSSGGIDIYRDATLALSNDGGVTNAAGSSDILLEGTYLQGDGTLEKTGSGVVAFGGNGEVTVDLSSDATIDVEAGTLQGSAYNQADWSGNEATLNIAAGATFDGAEGDIVVGGLTGAGTLQGGYAGQGSITVGNVDPFDPFDPFGDSFEFDGTIQDRDASGTRDGAPSTLSLTVEGGGYTQVLTGTNTYTGGTTIEQDATLQLGNGYTPDDFGIFAVKRDDVAPTATTGSIIGQVTDGGTLAFAEADGTPLTFQGTISDLTVTGTYEDEDGQTDTYTYTDRGSVQQLSGVTIFTQANTYTGGTTIGAIDFFGESPQTTIVEQNIGTALSSGDIRINYSGTLELANDGTGGDVLLQGTTLSGDGTLAKTGSSLVALGGNGEVYVGLNSDATIDVEQGTLQGSAYNQADYSENQAALFIAGGATFDGAEGAIVVGGLSGDGTLQGGYEGQGSTTIGAGTSSEETDEFDGTIQDRGADEGTPSTLSLTKIGDGTEVLTGSNTYTGGTTIDGGTIEALDTGAALGTGPVSLGSDGTLALTNDGNGATADILVGGTTISGDGTLEKDGSGLVAFGGAGMVDIAMAADGLIDVEAGTLQGSAYNQASYVGNEAGLYIAANAIFDGAEGAIVVGGLDGAGTLEGGYKGQGSVTIGAGTMAGDSDTFSGTLQDRDTSGKTDGAPSLLSLTKEGGGTQILTSALGYTGGTTVTGGVLQLGDGSGSLSGTFAIGVVQDGATLAFDEGGESNATITGQITDDGSAAGQVQQLGGETTFTTANSYTGGTTIAASGDIIEEDTGGALGSGPISIASGGNLNLFNDGMGVGTTGTGHDTLLTGTTITGDGVLQKNGSGLVAFGGAGEVNIELAADAVISVGDGTLQGSAYGQASYVGNEAALFIAGGTTFDGSEGAIVVGGLSGSGTLEGGYEGMGSTTIGAGTTAGETSTFSGTIRNLDTTGQTTGGKASTLALTVEGAGTQVLSSNNSYSGGTTLTGGILELESTSAAGSGAVALAAASGSTATLQLDPGALTTNGNISTYGNTITGLTGVNDIVDLTSLGFNANGSAAYNASTSTLAVSNGTDTVDLHVTGVGSGGSFVTAADATGGTSVHYDPNAAPTMATPKSIA